MKEVGVLRKITWDGQYYNTDIERNDDNRHSTFDHGYDHNAFENIHVLKEGRYLYADRFIQYYLSLNDPHHNNMSLHELIQEYFKRGGSVTLPTHHYFNPEDGVYQYWGRPFGSLSVRLWLESVSDDWKKI